MSLLPTAPALPRFSPEESKREVEGARPARPEVAPDIRSCSRWFSFSLQLPEVLKEETLAGTVMSHPLRRPHLLGKCGARAVAGEFVAFEQARRSWVASKPWRLANSRRA